MEGVWGFPRFAMSSWTKSKTNWNEIILFPPYFSICYLSRNALLDYIHCSRSFAYHFTRISNSSRFFSKFWPRLKTDPRVFHDLHLYMRSLVFCSCLFQGWKQFLCHSLSSCAVIVSLILHRTAWCPPYPILGCGSPWTPLVGWLISWDASSGSARGARESWWMLLVSWADGRFQFKLSPQRRFSSSSYFEFLLFFVLLSFFFPASLFDVFFCFFVFFGLSFVFFHIIKSVFGKVSFFDFCSRRTTIWKRTRTYKFIYQVINCTSARKSVKLRGR